MEGTGAREPFRAANGSGLLQRSPECQQDNTGDMAMTTVGFLYPGFAAEDDYPVVSAALGEDVQLVLVHTESPEDAHRVDALLELGTPERLGAGVADLLAQGSEAVVWACTSGSFVFGWEGAGEQRDKLAARAGVPASSTSFAFVHALQALGLDQVAYCATYPSDVADHFSAFLGRGGIDVVHTDSRGIMTAAEAATLGREQVLELVLANDHPDAAAILLPDTALHTVRWLEDLEDSVGKPVLTANQVTVWEGLRLAGHSRPTASLGSLFRHE